MHVHLSTSALKCIIFTFVFCIGYLKSEINYEVSGKVVYSGVLKSSLEYDLPILTCTNATLKTPVIIFNMSDNTSIVEIDNCIYLNARGREFLRLRDRLLYSYYGVIEDE